MPWKLNALMCYCRCHIATSLLLLLLSFCSVFFSHSMKISWCSREQISLNKKRISFCAMECNHFCSKKNTFPSIKYIFFWRFPSIFTDIWNIIVWLKHFQYFFFILVTFVSVNVTSVTVFNDPKPILSVGLEKIITKSNQTELNWKKKHGAFEFINFRPGKYIVNQKDVSEWVSFICFAKKRMLRAR